MANKDEIPADDVRVKFLDALEKKTQKGFAGNSGGPISGSKVGAIQASGGASKRFQRKSASE